MNIESSIESRKAALYSAYNITDNNIKKEIKELFLRIKDFGKTCKDNLDFEAKFTASESNTEYIKPLRHEAYEKSKEALRSNPIGNALFNANNHLENVSHLLKLAKKK